MITSEAGTRLAKAKVRRDQARQLAESMPDYMSPVFVAGRLTETEYEFKEAADALADELVKQGYHDLDGGEG